MNRRFDLLGAAALLVLAATAWSPPSAAAPARAQKEEESLEAVRLLHLAGGPVLRAPSRLVGDSWEVKRRDGWTPLPPGAVERAVLERDALARSRDLARSIGQKEHLRRVALADWMVQEGLYAEALGELDRVLAAEPDQANALALLPSLSGRVRLGSEDEPSLDALLRAACSATPSARELALLEAREAASREGSDLRAELGRRLQVSSVKLRALAALGLRRHFPGEELKGLAARAILDGSEEVRREAALSLRAAKDEAVVLPFLKAMSSASPPVRVNAIQALGTMGYPAAVAPLVSRLEALRRPPSAGNWTAPAAHIFVGRQVAYVQDFDVEVAQGSAIADPVINTLIEGTVLDVRVIGTSVQSVPVESAAIRAALERITLARPGGTSRSWLDWWEENKHPYLGGEPRTEG